VVTATEIQDGLDLLSPDVELDVSELIDGRVYRGRDAVRAYVEALHADVWRELRMEIDGIEDGGDVVIALVNCHAVGKRSGVPVDFRAAWVATLDDGLVTRARLTLDREAALDAAQNAAGLTLA
jgi:ketosteroid isomerase-like protein